MSGLSKGLEMWNAVVYLPRGLAEEHRFISEIKAVCGSIAKSCELTQVDQFFKNLPFREHSMDFRMDRTIAMFGSIRELV